MPLIDQAGSTIVPRATLAEVFTDPRLLLAMEQVLQIVSEVPDAINTLADAGMWLKTGSPLLPNARQVVPGVGVTLDYSVPGQVTLNVSIGITGSTLVTGVRQAGGDGGGGALVPPVPVGGVYLNGSVLQARQV